MLNSDALRRLVAVALLIAALVVLPAAPALAADGGSEGAPAASESEDQGIIEQAIDWLIDVLGGSSEGDLGAQTDPTGVV